ncbi:MAG TPA: TIGR02281 family clan AA aspartic protease [Myxococcota bacterium]|nr:TIGR02281 family clan AA aspartic protease [Myxococcota bacterium]
MFHASTLARRSVQSVVRGILAFALGTASLLPLRAAADIYRWVDSEGRLHVAQHLDEVPPEYRPAATPKPSEPGRGSVQTFNTPTAPPAAQAPGAAQAPLRRTYRIPVQRAGTGMLVQVRLNDRVTAPFLIDTGASDVLVPKPVADELGLGAGPDTRTVRYATANGHVDQPVVMLDAVDLGGARVEKVPASVSAGMEVGLLGLSYFNHFTYNIDAAAGIVTLTPNDLVESGAIRGGRSEAQWRAEFQNVRVRIVSIEAKRESVPPNHTRELQRLDDEKAKLERQLDLLETEADAARVPVIWRE